MELKFKLTKEQKKHLKSIQWLLSSDFKTYRDPEKCKKDCKEIHIREYLIHCECKCKTADATLVKTKK
jgi:hypothetical protein